MRLQHLLDACVATFRENEDLPNTTNPDDWPASPARRASGSSTSARSSPVARAPRRARAIDTVNNTGQYL